MTYSEKIKALSQSLLACNFSPAEIELIAGRFRWVEHASDQTVFRQNDFGDSLMVVIEGRVKLTVTDASGTERFVDHLGAGEHFGEISVLTGQERSLSVTATMDTKLLELDRADYQALVTQVPGLAANLSRALGFRLRRETTGKKVRNVSRVIGIVGDASEQVLGSRMLSRLATALSKEATKIRIITDRVDSTSNLEDYDVSEIPLNMNLAAKSDWVHRRLSEQNSYDGHTLVWLSDTDQEQMRRILVQCDKVFWLSGLRDESKNRANLKSLLAVESRLATRLHWGWLLRDGVNPGTIPSSPQGLGLPDFKIVLNSAKHSSRLEQMSISRLVRFIRKTRLGLALGGGAARGLAHLGVLKAFEEQGIFFDVIAGTSAGALMAVPYGTGLSPDECTEAFLQDLTPGWPFRLMPKGNEWYMLYQFRWGKWDGLLRNRIGDVKLEQLLTPVSTVSVDLITGRQVVRDRGDATHAILESINLPNISKPIMREGMALVDGGIINNIPSDILAERGADLTLGVDIATQIAYRFGKNRSGMPTNLMRAPSQLQTIMRAGEVQDHQITALRTRTVDQMIVVDTSMFDFADFTKAREMSEAGYQAATESLGQIRQMLKEQKASEAVASERFMCTPCLKSRS